MGGCAPSKSLYGSFSRECRLESVLDASSVPVLGGFRNLTRYPGLTNFRLFFGNAGNTFPVQTCISSVRILYDVPSC